MEKTKTGSTRYAFWVAHSPYSDRTWRGPEKCAGSSYADSGPMLFDTEKTCRRFIEQHHLTDFFTPVLVVLETPGVRCALDSLHGKV